jgi:hypothetical protein
MMHGMTIAKDLQDAEQRVRDAFPAGEIVEFGAVNAEDDDPSAGESWGFDRQVRAEVLAMLLCGAVGVETGQTGGIYLSPARVIGELRLPDSILKQRLLLNRCHVADGINLSEGTTPTLDLEGCHIGAISPCNAKLNGAFSLSGAASGRQGRDHSDRLEAHRHHANLGQSLRARKDSADTLSGASSTAVL